ncbi:MAG TPA: HdeD family acid-resistance protein [Gemmatimonadaceae bacterium]|nr:HdeD family acid-resistance protein [Gemmatimonadaceae bacterium]
MLTLVARNWGWTLLRGVAALIFGVLTLFNPHVTLVALVILFGSYAVVDGIFTIVSAIANRHGERSWPALLLNGLVSLAIGIVTFVWPGITTLALLFLIAAWAVITGVLEIVTAIRLRSVLRGEWLLILAGALSVLFGILLFIAPGPGALAVVLWIGAYACVFGILLIVLAFRLRSWLKSESGGATALAS